MNNTITADELTRWKIEHGEQAAWPAARVRRLHAALEAAQAELAETNDAFCSTLTDLEKAQARIAELESQQNIGIEINHDLVAQRDAIRQQLAEAQADIRRLRNKIALTC